jgi:hypothetical protein
VGFGWLRVFAASRALQIPFKLAALVALVAVDAVVHVSLHALMILIGLRFGVAIGDLPNSIPSAF